MTPHIPLTQAELQRIKEMAERPTHAHVVAVMEACPRLVAEIEALRTALKGLLTAWETPNEPEAIDAARAALGEDG